ncbi:hypothetical protein [Antrihabitans sp. YC2-6]|uniref:hypothetical protein n=1 Tax=Antrihabitans sp. YC2-6 TaxID=2799498 RepID=UPI0018F4C8B4|nr:hypothetical protein [Antrihabitans sp. YC2-6]MBJ8347610.1 hypothetical protein [Antrihabitans sp. YC2-6]
MRVHVVNLARSDEAPESIRTPTPPGIRELGQVLFATQPQNMAPFAIDNVLQVASPKWSLINDITVLRTHDVSGHIPEDVLTDVAERTERSPLYVLSTDSLGPRLQYISGEVVNGLDIDKFLAALREADINALLRRPGANLPPFRTLHYKGPGGHHYRSFARPGFAMRTTDDFDRVAFWLVPHLHGKSRVVVDHWSMLGLAHRAAAYAARFGEPQHPVTIESLTEYAEGSESLTARLWRAFPSPSDSGVVVLLSVSSTGSSAQRIAAVLNDIGQWRAKVVAIAQAPTDPMPTDIAFLAPLDDTHRRLPTPCPECAKHPVNFAVPIEQGSYLLRLSALTKKTAITVNVSKDAKAVVSRYGGHGVFGAHRTHDDGRHHAFFIDVANMIANSGFEAPLEATLDELCAALDESPVLLLHPGLTAAAAFADMVKARLTARGIEVSAVVQGDERCLWGNPSAKLLVAAPRVIFIDDAVITGTRIQAFRKALTRLRRDHGVDGRVDLWALVAVARPRSDSALRGIRDIVHHTGTHKRFFQVEQLLLPNWLQSNCSWCREIEMIDQLPSELQDYDIIAARRNTLQDEDQDHLMFCWPTADLAAQWDLPSTRPAWEDVAAQFGGRHANRWELNRESIFGDIQGVDLLVCIASCIQRLRTSSPEEDDAECDLDERFRSPVSKILDPHLYLLGRFYEPVILAAIMRAANPHDISPPEGDPALDEGLQSQIGWLTSSSEMLGELLTQVGLGVIPNIPKLAEFQFQNTYEQRIAAWLCTRHAQPE